MAAAPLVPFVLTTCAPDLRTVQGATFSMRNLNALGVGCGSGIFMSSESAAQAPRDSVRSVEASSFECCMAGVRQRSDPVTPTDRSHSLCVRKPPDAGCEVHQEEGGGEAGEG